MVSTPHVRAELMALAPEGLTPGATVWLGLQITHQPEWHTYWKNPGDSGLATELRWTLPPGLDAGEIDWPAPHKIAIGPLANYGYEGTVLLPVPLQVAQTFRPPLDLGAASGGVPIQLSATWLVCRLECIPESGEFTLNLPARGSTALNGEAFARALADRPLAPSQHGVQGALQVAGDQLQLRVSGLPAALRGKPLAVYPETAEVLRNGTGSPGAAPPTATTSNAPPPAASPPPAGSWQNDGVWQTTLPLDPHRSTSPATMELVLARAGADREAATQAGQPVAWRLQAPVTGTWPPAAARAEVPAALQAALDQNAAGAAATKPPSALAPPPGPAAGASFWAALAGALLGGLLLNLMPCVFPVLALKVLGIARHGGDAASHRRGALAYTVGVLLSLLALGGLMLALRAAGTQLGWGFQLQSPAMVAALAALFTAIGLNLAGLFEVGLLAPRALAGAQLRHPVRNDFLSGVLAVLVASPCTAPFMGASLGLAIGLPPVQALALFAALGLGLALPYLLVGFVPAAARLLPQPGAWMEQLRRLLAFPMFATVAWLVWVLGQQSGIDGAAALLGLLVAGSAVVWALGQRGRARLVLGALTLAVAAFLLPTLGPQVLRELPAASATTAAPAGARWQPWSAERVAQLQAQGRPVFIDFTAAWCVTCQYNKKTTLSDPAVLAGFDARGVALLRADWTRRDPAIGAALAALGRSGVPVYVLAAPGRAPVVLSEILSPADLQAALARL